MAYCIHCGTEIRSEAAFCHECGAETHHIPPEGGDRREDSEGSEPPAETDPEGSASGRRSRLSRIPGIDREQQSTRRNLLVGGGYGIFGIFAVLLVTGDSEDPDEDEAPTGNDEPPDDDGTQPPEDPEFSLVDFEVPAGVDVGDEFTIAVVIENSGEADGTFTGDLVLENDRGEERSEIALDVDVGTTETFAYGPEEATFATELEVRIESDHLDEDVGERMVLRDPEFGTTELGEFEGSFGLILHQLQLEEGAVFMDAVHEGDRSFDVRLENDERVHELVTTEGPYDGRVGMVLEEETHELHVDAQDDWKIVFTSPWVEVGQSLPVSAEDTTDRILGPFAFVGSDTLEATHDGEGDFEVDMYFESGPRESLLHETGPVEESVPLVVDDPAWIAVEATGPWSMTIASDS